MYGSVDGKSYTKFLLQYPYRVSQYMWIFIWGVPVIFSIINKMCTIVQYKALSIVY
jgi:hypothetical protein